MGDETLAQLKRRVTACGFYSGLERMKAMHGRLGLENARRARVGPDDHGHRTGQRLSFAPTRLDLADVEATPLRTRKARLLPDSGSGIHVYAVCFVCVAHIIAFSAPVPPRGCGCCHSRLALEARI